MKLKKKYSPSDITQLICVLYICIWVISPPLAYGVLYRVFVVAATIIWLCIELKNRPRNLLGSSRPTLFVFVFVFYSAIVGYLVEGSTDLIRNFQIYICLLFLVFYESYRKRDIRQLRPVFWISVILLSGWAFLTLIGLNANENVARILVRSSDLAEEYSGQGIGGYGLVYSLIIGVPVALYLVKSGDLLKYMPKKGYFFQACLVFFLTLSILVILKAGYSIALTIMAFSMLLLFLLKARRNFFLVVIGGVTLISIVWLFIGEIMDAAYLLTEKTPYHRKFQDIQYFFQSDKSIGTLYDRVERYIRSLLLFLEHPFFGVFEFTHIGKHSSILDRFARYGIIIGSMYAYLLWYLPLRHLKKASKTYGLAIAVTFVAITFPLLNNVTSAYGYMLYIFYPVALSYVDDTRKRNKNFIRKYR